MERVKLKSYCQFCLREQNKDHPKIPIDRIFKQNYFKITQKKVKFKRESKV